MSTAAMHLAVARLPWLRARRGSPWTSLAILLVLPVSVALLVAMLRVRPDLAVVMVLLGALVTVWYQQVDGWTHQNLPMLARHLPGQLRVLRTQLLGVGLGVSLLAAGLLGSVSELTPLQWLPVTTLVVLALAWLARMPLLWALIWIPQLGFQSTWKLLQAAMQSELGAAGALALLVMGLWPLVGKGGRLHRRLSDGMLRWRAAALAAQRGEIARGAGVWPWTAVIARFFAWPLHAWRRRLERQASPQNAVARVDAWLSGSGHWTLQVQAVALMLLAGALAVAILLLNLHDATLHRLLSNMGGFGLGLIILLQLPSTQKQLRLQSTRREQALLALLPGPPAGAGLGAALRRRWALQALMTSLLCVLVFGAVWRLASGSMSALAGAFLATLLFAPLHLLRDWSGNPKPSLFDQSGLMIVAALLAAASLFQPWAAWWPPLLALPLALALFVHQWRQTRHYGSQFPIGRRYSGSSVK